MPAALIALCMTRDENHPLHKPMVDHNQNRVETRGRRQIRDHVARDLLERAGGGRGDGTKPRNSRVSVNLVGLASSAASHKLVNKGGKSRPPVVALNQVNGAEITAVAPRWGAMQRMYQVLPSWLGDVKTALVVESTVEERPVIAGHVRKERGMLSHSIGGILHEGVGCGELGDAVGKADVQSTYQNIRNRGQHSNSGVVERGINLVAARKCIGWIHL